MDRWSEVDEFFAGGLLDDPMPGRALGANAEAGLPRIDVSPLQGKFLRLLAQSIGARSILEVGTLGGYSTIWLAGALPPDGRLVTLEIDERHAGVARSNVERAGFGDVVEVRVGAALGSLDALIDDGSSFDLTFIDADKASTAEYFQRALDLSREGSLIVVDNVVRDGRVLDPDSGDPNIDGMRRFFELLAEEARADATVVQTVGTKGYDGFALIRVRAAWRPGGSSAEERTDRLAAQGPPPGPELPG